MTFLHILGGILAILFGAAALAAPKGRRLHRLSGRGFVAAMLLMTLSALMMATYLRPNPGNIIAAGLSAYLVLSGLFSVREPLRTSAGWRLGLWLWVCVLTVCAAALARVASAQPGGMIDGIPYEALTMFAAVAALASVGDLRILLGRQLSAEQTRRRHLWRMGYAMWVATLSLFLGQARQFPEPIRESGLLNLPVLWVTVSVLWAFLSSALRSFRQRTRATPQQRSTEPA